MADGLIKIQGSTNVGKCVDAINDNFQYLDGKTPAGEDILEQAKAYTNFRADAISASTNEALQARVMKETGNDLPSLYKETSEGGLAKDYKPMQLEITDYGLRMKDQGCAIILNLNPSSLIRNP